MKFSISIENFNPRLKFSISIEIFNPRLKFSIPIEIVISRLNLWKFETSVPCTRVQGDAHRSVQQRMMLSNLPPNKTKLDCVILLCWPSPLPRGGDLSYLLLSINASLFLGFLAVSIESVSKIDRPNRCVPLISGITCRSFNSPYVLVPLFCWDDSWTHLASNNAKGLLFPPPQKKNLQTRNPTCSNHHKYTYIYMYTHTTK